ncbi:uncharacterized protein LOC129235225 [Uloborus diversus]|uniref:uncharacterized protein LOC129235225 n=1 Tax=Uloborus diversus TaxID=327109 RepID=UPI00240A7DD3|nr:uncharacterized protein LOC129235225 [Uloborus diversus]
MDTVLRCCFVGLLFGLSVQLCDGIGCFTCTVDFRSDPFSVNNTCLFPKDGNDLGHCSHNQKFCKAIITRIGGVFVMLQRSCSEDCAEACIEKGYGIKIQDCSKCCTKENDCGTASLMRK